MFAEIFTEAGAPGRGDQRRHRRRAGGRRPLIVGHRTSTWSRSPVRHPWVDQVMADRGRHRASACTWSWAARRPSSCSTTPTSRPRSTGPWPASLINTGQDCTAATRAIVHRSLYDAFVAGSCRPDVRGPVGPTRWIPDTDLGPAHLPTPPGQGGRLGRPRARGYARVVTGGRRSPAAILAAGLLLRAHPDRRRAARLAEIGLRRGLRAGARAVRCRSTTTTRRSAWPTTRRSGWPRPRGPRDTYRPSGPSRDPAGCVWINDHIPIISEMPHGGFQVERVRQGHVGLLLRGIHQRQARHARTSPGWPARAGTGRSSRTGRAPSPASAVAAEAAYSTSTHDLP
jgi:hypothetical protein